MILNRASIYIAAPLFSLSERSVNERIRNKLSVVGDVYLPQEDGALLVDLVRGGASVAEAKALVFQRDIDAINRCNILLINMDGRVIDEGASFELGYAFAMGKTCIGLKTDVRSLLPIGDNPMIECALRCVFNNEDDVVDWVAAGEWKPS